MTLIDRFSVGYRRPFWRLERIEDLNSVTAFVNVEDGSIVAFQFQYNDNSISVAGNAQAGTVRLSHHLKGAEVITKLVVQKRPIIQALWSR